MGHIHGEAINSSEDGIIFLPPGKESATGFSGLELIPGLLTVAFVLLVAYYFMLWPFQPSLEVDDPVIAEWLRQNGVVIYRRGEELAGSRMYLIEGERFGNGCSWHAGSSGSDDYVVVSRQIAMNHTTCESLIEEGKLIE